GWDVRTGRQTFAFTIPEGRYRQQGEDTNGSVVALADARGRDPIVTLWDLRSGQEIARLDEAVPGLFSLPATGSLVAFDDLKRPGEILVYDLVRRAFHGRLDGMVAGLGQVKTVVHPGTLSPDGRLLAAYAGAAPN